MTRISKIILIINVIIFLLGMFLMEQNFPWYETFALWDVSEYSQPYQLLTHMFMHSDFMHIFFNMLILVFLGSVVENHFKEKKFIIFYLLCGLGAASLHMLFTDTTLPMVGASGALYGIFIASALIKPNMKVSFFFIPVKLKVIVTILFLFEIYNSLTVFNDNVAHIAHVGGALTGISLFFINKLLKNKKWLKNF